MITKRRDIILFQEVHQFLEDNYNKEIPIAYICKEFGVNRTKLQGGFNQLFGVSVHAFISQLRMEKARKMLKETDEPVKIIGMECGYKTLSSFTRVFTKLHDVSPTQYRMLADTKEILSEKMSETGN
ncbi:MAG: helix-turn-helix transcriptional regulator [Chitinophagaceae bacterium]|nr:helix-turn-helix transcriptional regulator [Chitinophagaceae bacterium]